MKHEDAAPALLERLQGPSPVLLPGDLEEHVRGCEECRALSETHAALVLAFGGRDAPGSHLTSEEIVRVALGSPGREEFTAHVRACARCAWEVENVRSAEDEAVSEPPRQQAKPVEARSLSPNWLAMAAGLAVLVLLYPAYLGTFRLPGVAGERRALAASEREARDRIAQLEGSLSEARRGSERLGWTGAVQVPVLAPPLRGRPPRATQIPVEPGQPFLALALDLTSVDRLQAASVVHVAVRRPDGAEAWSLDLPGSEVRDRTAVGGVLSLLIPSEKLPRGSYTLRLEVPGSAAPPLFEASFAVTTGFSPEVPR